MQCACVHVCVRMRACMHVCVIVDCAVLCVYTVACVPLQYFYPQKEASKY